MRDPEITVVKARAAVRAPCGATDLWRPHAVGEGFFETAMPVVLALIITG